MTWSKKSQAVGTTSSSEVLKAEAKVLLDKLAASVRATMTAKDRFRSCQHQKGGGMKLLDVILIIVLLLIGGPLLLTAIAALVESSFLLVLSASASGGCSDHGRKRNRFTRCGYQSTCTTSAEGLVGWELRPR